MKLIGLGTILTGAVLLFYGASERDSVTSEVRVLGPGARREHSVLLIACGGGLTVTGAGLLLFGRKIDLRSTNCPEE